MKKKTKKLYLNRETVSTLTRSEMEKVVGGMTFTCLQSCVYGCMTNELSNCRECYAV